MMRPNDNHMVSDGPNNVTRVNEHLGTALNIAAAQAEYDEHAKNLLANKIILAHILAHVADEFRGMSPQEI